MISINIYRYNPEKDQFPYMQTYKFEQPKRDIMVLELLNQLKEKDDKIEELEKSIESMKIQNDQKFSEMAE